MRTYKRVSRELENACQLGVPRNICIVEVSRTIRRCSLARGHLCSDDDYEKPRPKDGHGLTDPRMRAEFATRDAQNRRRPHSKPEVQSTVRPEV